MYLLDYPKRLFIIFCFIGFLTFSVWHASFFIWTFFSCSDLCPFFLFFFSTQNNIRFRIKECYRENVCQAYVWHAYFFSGTCFFLLRFVYSLFFLTYFEIFFVRVSVFFNMPLHVVYTYRYMTGTFICRSYLYVFFNDFFVHVLF